MCVCARACVSVCVVYISMPALHQITHIFRFKVLSANSILFSRFITTISLFILSIVILGWFVRLFGFASFRRIEDAKKEEKTAATNS